MCSTIAHTDFDHDDHDHHDDDHFLDSYTHQPALSEGIHTDHDHNIGSELTARTLRQYGHVIEGTCTVIAGAIKVYTSVYGNSKHTRLLKIASNVMQALSAVGTAMAAIADFGHGHLIHAVCHTVQALCTLAQTIPNIMKKMAKNAGLTPAETDKREEFRQKFIITGNFIDVVPSIILSILMKSPPYAVEAVFNFLLGFENILNYNNYLNTKKAMIVTTDSIANKLFKGRCSIDITVDEGIKSELEHAITCATKKNDSTTRNQIESAKTQIDQIMNDATIKETDLNNFSSDYPEKKNDDSDERVNLLIENKTH